MNKKFLITAALLLSITGTAYSAQPAATSNTQSDIHQKACQNVFSFVNIDVSMMSPRGTAADVTVSDTEKAGNAIKKDPVIPIANKTESKQATKNSTSLFRLDLLHIIKFQLF